MELRNYGEIKTVSFSSFTWEIPDFHIRIRNNNYLYSKHFQFDGDTWYMYLNKYYGVFRLFLARTDGHSSRTITYSLHIKDVSGAKWWTSPVLTEEFMRDKWYGADQIIFKISVMNNLNTIAPGGVLSVHLTFNPPRREDLESAKTELSQSSSILRNQGLTSIIDGGETVLQKFKDLLLSERKSDVTFTVQGREFKAHTSVLIAQSSVFEKMFEHDMVEQRSGSVQITDCHPDVFHIFLLYLYSGKVDTLTVDSAVDLYCIADKYDIKGLVTGCAIFLLNNLSTESFCEIVSLGLRHCDRKLLESAYTFFAENMKDIVASAKWRSFVRENPDEANEIFIEALSEVKLLPQSRKQKRREKLDTARISSDE